MIEELQTLNKKLKDRMNHIAKVFSEYDESTDYEMLPTSNYFEIGDIVDCHLVDVSGNMASVSFTLKEPFYKPIDKEMCLPINALESWDDEHLIQWFILEEARLSNKELEETYRPLLNILQHCPDLVKDLVGVTDREQQLEIIERHL